MTLMTGPGWNQVPSLTARNRIRLHQVSCKRVADVSFTYTTGLTVKGNSKSLRPFRRRDGPILLLLEIVRIDEFGQQMIIGEEICPVVEVGYRILIRISSCRRCFVRESRVQNVEVLVADPALGLVFLPAEPVEHGFQDKRCAFCIF